MMTPIDRIIVQLRRDMDRLNATEQRKVVFRMEGAVTADELMQQLHRSD